MFCKFSLRYRFATAFAAVAFLLVSLPGFAQDSTSKEIISQAYEDVWVPFMESYRALDLEQFKSIQSKDLTKVSIGKSIQPTATYFKSIEGFFTQFKNANRPLDIKFAMESSAVGEGKIYQTGYYCVSSRASDSDPFAPLGYGYFTVVLEKSEGKWKLALDADKSVKMTWEKFSAFEQIYALD